MDSGGRSWMEISDREELFQDLGKIPDIGKKNYPKSGMLEVFPGFSGSGKPSQYPHNSTIFVIVLCIV
jgi:hypothetical protein